MLMTPTFSSSVQTSSLTVVYTIATFVLPKHSLDRISSPFSKNLKGSQAPHRSPISGPFIPPVKLILATTPWKTHLRICSGAAHPSKNLDSEEVISDTKGK